ncbi:hypothetical protein STXM2123_3875 [Streptomyces sp. F-3]|nr:hypothetical protein STXM2123_3875 [Streptomyces sp. F-3]
MFLGESRRLSTGWGGDWWLKTGNPVRIWAEAGGEGTAREDHGAPQGQGGRERASPTGAVGATDSGRQR